MSVVCRWQLISAVRLVAVAVALAGFAGCASPAADPPAAGTGPADASAAADVAQGDGLATGSDVAQGDDLAVPVDMAQGEDAAATPDLLQGNDSVAVGDVAQDTGPDLSQDDAWDAGQDASADVAVNAAEVGAIEVAEDVAADAAEDAAGDTGSVCIPTNQTTEVCDGLDNDCNGTTDVGPGSEQGLCNDGNSCTADTCAGTKGCSAAPASEANCDDGNPCTGGDFCAAATCKAGTPKCNDANVCTTDSCDAKIGDCVYAAIVGCKACKVAADCNDANDCTTDGCTVGACAVKPVAGCVGPTDYQIKALSVDKPEINLGEALKLTFTVSNLGKPYSGTFPGALKWAIYVSADQVADSADFKLLGDSWTNDNLGPPNKTEYTMLLPFYPSVTGKWDQVYWCLQLTGGADSNTANNTACIGNPLKPAELTLATLLSNDATVVASTGSSVTVGITNSGGTSGKIAVKLFASVDATWAAADLLLASAEIPAVAKVSKKDYVVTYKPASTVQATHKFLCVQIDPVGAVNEKVPGDNVLCVPQSFVNPADLAVAVADVGFSTTSYVAVDSPNWGVDYGCVVKKVSNPGTGIAVPPVKVRCWVGAANGWDLAKWKFEWDSLKDPNSQCYGGDCWVWPAGAKAKVDLLPKAAAKICVSVNPDMKILETNFANNVACRDFTVLGPDLSIAQTVTKVGAAKYYDAQPTAISRGAALNVEMGLCNVGNQTLTNLVNLKTRILLSKDNLPSADDYEIHKGTGVGFPEFKPMGTYPYNCGSLFNGKTATLPMSLAAGVYFLIFDVNHDKAYLEPQEFNALVHTVTVK